MLTAPRGGGLLPEKPVEPGRDILLQAPQARQAADRRLPAPRARVMKGQDGLIYERDLEPRSRAGRDR